MNIELAQTIALIAYGNEYLSSPRRESHELFPSHSTFQYVSGVSFQTGKTLDPLLGGLEIVAKNTRDWFSRLRIDGIRYLKLDLLNMQHLPPPYATSLLTAGGNWVVQTDQERCWLANWSFINHEFRQARLWKVAYREHDNTPVIRGFPNIEIAYRNLENSLLEAENFSEKRNFGWEKCFGKAIELLRNPVPVQPFYTDLLPPTFENVKVRQLLAGALQAWVFGGLGSWNDMYITNNSVEQEYQQISKNLHGAVIQSVGAVTNSTADDRLRALSTC
jgi:hypothetical protein